MLKNHVLFDLRTLPLASLCALVLVWYASGPVAAATEDVVWTSLVHARTEGSTIIATSDVSSGGGVSTQAIVSGDGYMEHTVAEFGTNRAAGLSNGNTDEELSDIDFAIRLNGAGSAEIWEGGLYRAETTYVTADIFRVAVVGGQVRYSKNGTVFYDSLNTPSWPGQGVESGTRSSGRNRTFPGAHIQRNFRFFMKRSLVKGPGTGR